MNMRPPCIVLLMVVLACLVGVPARAEFCAAPLAAPTSDTLAKVQAAARNRGFLWRMSKGGHVSYLYGTLHVARLEWSFPGPALAAALQASEHIALELNLRDAAQMQQLQEGTRASTAGPLRADLQERMQRQAQRNCLDEAGLRALRPEMQISTLEMAAARMQGLESAYSAEMVLVSYAQASNKPIDALETVAEQLDSFLATNDDEMQSVAQSGLQDLESGAALQLVGKLARVWASSDYAELSRYARWCDCMKSAADRRAMQRLLDDRNPRLAERIDALHSEGHVVFAAVGALHMIGTNGLPARMRKRGYHVQRIF